MIELLGTFDSNFFKVYVQNYTDALKWLHDNFYCVFPDIYQNYAMCVTKNGESSMVVFTENLGKQLVIVPNLDAMPTDNVVTFMVGHTVVGWYSKDFQTVYQIDGIKLVRGHHD